MNKRNLELLYKDASDKQISKDKKETEKQISSFEKKRKTKDKYLTRLKTLVEALDDYEKIHDWVLWKPFAFFYLKNMLNSQDKEIKARLNQEEEILTKNMNRLSFFELNLAKTTKHNQKKFLKSQEIEEYKHYLEKIFIQAKYNLSEKEETILTIKSKTSYTNWVRMLSDFIDKEQRDWKTFEELMTLTKHTEKETRDNAAKHINDILKKQSDIAEIEINSVLEHKKQNDELRKLPRPDTSRHISDDIETEIVDKLVKTITKNFNISKDYYKLKSKILKLKKLEYHERNIPIWNITKKFTYKTAVKLVKQSFINLDPQFWKIFDKFIDEERIDVYPQKWKSWWACNIRFGKNEPNFVMLNYTETLNDITTLAHEMGHAINTTLCQKNQNSLNFWYWMATAEVASIFMEDFILSKLLEVATPEEKLIIMMEKLNDTISSVFRQIACYNFETELHKEFRKIGYLDKETIWKIFQNNMKAYMWDSVEQSEWSENRRIYRSHIRSFFYVYSYASWLLISKNLQRKTKENPEFIKTIKNDFLSVWSKKSPKEIFLNMWIEINKSSFRNEWIKEIKEMLKETEKLAKELGYI